MSFIVVLTIICVSSCSYIFAITLPNCLKDYNSSCLQTEYAFIYIHIMYIYINHTLCLVPKCMNYQKTIVVVTGRHCFYDYIYIYVYIDIIDNRYIYIYIYICVCVCVCVYVYIFSIYV